MKLELFVLVICIWISWVCFIYVLSVVWHAWIKQNCREEDMDAKDVHIQSLKSEIKGLKWSFDEMTKERDYWKNKYKNRGKPVLSASCRALRSPVDS